MKLPGIRYEQIKWKVVHLFEKTGEDSIPVDPFAIAAELGIVVVPYRLLGKTAKAACLKVSESGFKFCFVGHDGLETRYVFYNDQKPCGHVRFTVLHEIGHIVLGHLQESEVAEAEANFFAKYAIAPPMLVRMIEPTDYMDIAEAFGLSRECALYAWNYYRRWLRISGYKDYELNLESIFSVIDCGGGGAVAKVLRMKKGA